MSKEFKQQLEEEWEADNTPNTQEDTRRLDDCLAKIEWKKVYRNKPFKAVGTDTFSSYFWTQAWKGGLKWYGI